MEAVATIDLHGFVHGVIEDFATEHFSDGTFDGVFLENLHRVRALVPAGRIGLHGLINDPRRAIDHGLQGKSPNGDLRELGPHQAEVADGMAESRALLGVMCGGFELVFREAEAGGAERETADIENVEGDDVATADIVQQVFARHVAILEKDRCGRTPAQAHFLFFRAHGKSRRPTLNDERREFFAIDFRENSENIRESAVGDPHFLAVQDPMAAVRRQRGAGAGILRVGTCLRLGETVRGQPFAGGEFGQIFFLLLLGAEINDGQRADS